MDSNLMVGATYWVDNRARSWRAFLMVLWNEIVSSAIGIASNRLSGLDKPRHGERLGLHSAELSQHRPEYMIPKRRAYAEVLCRESVVALVVFQ